MELAKWKIKSKIYHFPKSWDKDRVMSFINLDIRVCPICFKIDVGLNHFDKCDPQKEAIRQQRTQDYYN